MRCTSSRAHLANPVWYLRRLRWLSPMAERSLAIIWCRRSCTKVSEQRLKSKQTILDVLPLSRRHAAFSLRRRAASSWWNSWWKPWSLQISTWYLAKNQLHWRLCLTELIHVRQTIRASIVQPYTGKTATCKKGNDVIGSLSWESKTSLWNKNGDFFQSWENINCLCNCHTSSCGFTTPQLQSDKLSIDSYFVHTPSAI